MSAQARRTTSYEIRINGELVPRGERRVIRVPVVTDLDGCEIALFVHAVAGAKPGPVLAMHTALHGSEWQTVEITLLGRVVTIILNGQTVIDRAIIPGITGGALDSREGEAGPIMIQGDHGPIEFRKVTVTPAE